LHHGIAQAGSGVKLSSQLFVISLTLFFSVECLAAQESTFSQSSTTLDNSLSASSTMDELEQHPWRIYGGAATGYGNVSGHDYSAAPDGSQTLLSGDLSFQTPRWVFEAGAGWMYSSFSGAQDGVNIAIHTRSGFGDASARYRLNQHWQLGVAYNNDFGTDTHFGPTVGADSDLSLLGIRTDYEIALGRVPFRIVLQGLGGIGIGNRNYVLTTLGFQVGLPFGNAHAATVVAEEMPIHVSSAAEVAAPEEVRIWLDPEKIFFRTMSDQVRPEAKKTLFNIGQYLAQNEEDWGSLELDGHADQRGKADYNMRLSKRRADAIENIFNRAGVPDNRLTVRYFGFTRLANPNNTPLAWAENRRVELVFEDVKDPKALKDKFEELQKFQVNGDGNE
jgi:outer membrane protein OmpA-like peptidoglycan-associated protein